MSQKFWIKKKKIEKNINLGEIVVKFFTFSKILCHHTLKSIISKEEISLLMLVVKFIPYNSCQKQIEQRYHIGVFYFLECLIINY